MAGRARKIRTRWKLESNLTTSDANTVWLRRGESRFLVTLNGRRFTLVAVFDLVPDLSKNPASTAHTPA